MSSSTLSANSLDGSAFDPRFLGSTIRVSGSVSSYADQHGAGGSSSITVEASSGEISPIQNNVFVSGATFVSTSTSTSDRAITASAIVLPNLETPITLILGTAGKNLLESTPEREIFWGGNGADIFRLSAIGALTFDQADIILDYSREQGDYLALSPGLTVAQLNFQVVDLSGDGIVDATAVRSLVNNTILGIVRNTVNEFGNTLLSAADIASSDRVAEIEHSGGMGRVRFTGDRSTPYNLSLIQNGDKLAITFAASGNTTVALQEFDPLKIEPGTRVNSSSTWIKLVSHDTLLLSPSGVLTTDICVPTLYQPALRT